jgi:hypothetical protein
MYVCSSMISYVHEWMCVSFLKNPLRDDDDGACTSSNCACGGDHYKVLLWAMR